MIDKIISKIPTSKFTQTVFTIKTLRLLLLALLFVMGSVGVKATDYVFEYNGGYLAVSNTGAITYTTTFSRSCIWTCVSNTTNLTAQDLSTTSRYLYTEVNGTRYWLDGSTTNGAAPTVSTTAPTTARWRNSDNRLYYYNNDTYYLYYRGNSWRTSSSSGTSGTNNNYYARTYTLGGIRTEYRSTTNTVTTTLQGPTDNTTAAISISGNTSNTITFSHGDLTGTYAPVYTRYTYDGNTVNYYNGTSYGTSVPSVNANTLSPTFSWSLYNNGGGAATIDSSTGVMTLSNEPTSNIIVRLTVSNISPLSDKNIDFVVSRNTVDEYETTSTSLSDVTLTPTSATLDFVEGLEFTASATATGTTTTIPAHVTLTGSGNTYYYYNNTLNTTPPTGAVSNESITPTYTWTLSGAAAENLTLSAKTGTTTTATYSTGSQTNASATLTVTVSTPGATSKTATATITVTPLTATAIDASNLTLYMGESGVVEYTLTPTAAYNQVRATSSDNAVFTVDASPVTDGKVAITPVAPGEATLTLVSLKPNGTDGPSKVVTITVRDRVAAPEISFVQDGSSVKAVMSTTTAGATIRYTTDGSDPATSATAQTYNDSSRPTVTDGTTVKAIATKGDGWDNSAVTEATCNPIDYVEGGVAGGTVTLNDLEDHNWTYYSGVDATVDGGNYNTNYLGKLYSPNPRNVKITYKGVNGINGSSTKVKVSISENDSSFVYYKTLEESATSGEYQYQVISNPFSVRPSTGTGNSKVYYGFAGWEIKSGGKFIKGHNDGDVLSLDENIVFENLDQDVTYTPNCLSAEIVFETTWKQANRTYVSSNPGNGQTYSTSGDYESNFYVINCNYTRTITTSGPVTIMMVEPDGSSDYRTNYTFTGNITTNNNGVTKIEWADWNPSGDIDARGRNLTIGRGVAMGGTTRALVGTGQTTGMNQVLKVESGTFSTFTSYTTNPSSITKHWVVLGCDYDRAKNDNSKLTFTGRFLTGQGRTLGLSSTEDMVRTWSKSGRFMTNVQVANADAENSYYMGITNTHNAGHRYLEIEGGEWNANITGGMGETHTTTVPGFTLRIKGGIVRGSIYGAAAWATAAGLRTYVLTGGTIGGWVAGGANGTSQDEGALNGTSYIYVGGNTKVDSNGSTDVINRAIGGNVFGAGCGYNTTSTSGQVTYGTNVVVADNAYVERGVYGGGSYGYCSTDATSNIYITGGTVDGKPGGVSGTSYNANITGGVFGGACQNKGGTVNIYMNGGEVHTGLYGGSNANGTISGNVTMQINGGQVGTDAEHTANIHGGGYGSATVISGNVDLTLGEKNQTEEGVTVYGDVYGGSALGRVNTNASNHTNVTLNAGTVYGSVYGGALGDDDTAANVYGPVMVTVNGGSVKDPGNGNPASIFGCNNVYGSPQNTVQVIVNKTDTTTFDGAGKKVYAINGVYGGGNQAHYTYDNNNYPTVTVNGCESSIKDVYGGGNAAAVPSTNVTINGGDIYRVFGGGNGESNIPAHIGYQNKTENSTATPYSSDGDVNVEIHGGTIHQVFGGSNAHGTVKGTININVEEDGNCEMHIDELYGGGNEAPSNKGNITIGCTGSADNDEGIGSVYGGANAADVTGDIELNINAGRVENVFGGNNTSGKVDGAIVVNIEKKNTSCDWYVGNVYGGGNEAPYEVPSGKEGPTVNIKNGLVSQNVYGGGKGTTAIVTGNPVVTVGDLETAAYQTTVTGNVYGGGDAAAVIGATTVLLQKDNSEAGQLFGGGKSAGISETATVNMTGGKVVTGIYGGCDNSGSVAGDINVTLTSGTVGAADKKANVHGGGYGFNTKTDGNVDVNISQAAGKTLTIYGDVYGGSALGDVNSGTEDYTHVNLNGGTIYGDAYGGGLGSTEQAAYVNGNVKVTQNGVAFVKGVATVTNPDGSEVVNAGRIFGCNNLNGSPKGTVLVLINSTVATNSTNENKIGQFELQAVYGGGNLAAYQPTDDEATGQYTTNHDATKRPVQVVIDGCKDVSIQYVYGGGNAASTPATDVLVLGAFEIDHVFGGGNGKDSISYDNGANWAGNPGADVGYVKIDGTNTAYGSGLSTATLLGGTINHAFGGSNTKGNIRTSANVNLDEVDPEDCPLIVTEVYGGGNEAYMDGRTAINLGCISSMNELYGGSKAADVGSDVVLTITSGHFNRVFGGNNISGKIKGSITVNVEETGCKPVTIGELYGCGNMAAYSVNDKDGEVPAADPTINIKSFTSIGRVFGGGLGKSATVTGNPTVNINEIVGGNTNMASTYPGKEITFADKTKVTLPEHEAGTIGAIGEVYGGGNAAPVEGNTIVNVGTEETVALVSGTDHSEKAVVGVSITGNVFGAGLGETATVSGNTNVTIGH